MTILVSGIIEDEEPGLMLIEHHLQVLLYLLGIQLRWQAFKMQGHLRQAPGVVTQRTGNLTGNADIPGKPFVEILESLYF